MAVGTRVSPGPGPCPLLGAGWGLLINRVILKAAGDAGDITEEETEQREVKEVSPTQGGASPSLQTCSRVYLGSSQAPIGHSAPCPVLWLQHLLDTLCIKSSPTRCRVNCAHFTDEKDEVESDWKSSPWSQSQKVGKESRILTPMYVSRVCAPDHSALGLTRVHVCKLYNL